MSLLRSVSIAMPAQLSLQVDPPTGDAAGWWALSEPARLEAMGLLARLIARDVLAGDEVEEAPSW